MTFALCPQSLDELDDDEPGERERREEEALVQANTHQNEAMSADGSPGHLLVRWLLQRVGWGAGGGGGGGGRPRLGNETPTSRMCEGQLVSAAEGHLPAGPAATPQRAQLVLGSLWGPRSAHG